MLPFFLTKSNSLLRKNIMNIANSYSTHTFPEIPFSEKEKTVPCITLAQVRRAAKAFLQDKYRAVEIELPSVTYGKELYTHAEASELQEQLVQSAEYKVAPRTFKFIEQKISFPPGMDNLILVAKGYEHMNRANFYR